MCHPRWAAQPLPPPWQVVQLSGHPFPFFGELRVARGLASSHMKME